MFALSLLDGLNNKISKFLTDEDELDYMSDKEYERELNGFFAKSTKGILEGLKGVILIAVKEDCDGTKSRLSKDLAQVQAKLKTLRFHAEDVPLKANDGVEGVKHLQTKVKFCERVSEFYTLLIEQVQEWSDGALTIEESKVCFFAPLKESISAEALSFIYDNLVARSWIDGRQTSKGDFIYRFTGEGLPPTHPIKWLKKNTSLGILLNELTDDKDKWSKATAVFTIYSSEQGDYAPIGRQSLGNGYRTSVGTNSYRRQLKEIQEKILTSPEEQMRRAMSRWE